MFNKRSYVLRRLVLLSSIISLFFLLWPFIAYSQQPCPSGQVKCGNVCVNLQQDSLNCGVCGNACGRAANVTAANCSTGRCVITQCAPGWADCDGVAANGCERNIATDSLNCGACGNKCPPVANAEIGCSTGRCVISQCSPGWADCDGVFANGCERNIATDSLNCGVCGNKCPVGTTCSGGKCVGASATGTRINLQVGCGPCGTDCAAGQTCLYVNGACVLSCH